MASADKPKDPETTSDKKPAEQLADRRKKARAARSVAPSGLIANAQAGLSYVIIFTKDHAKSEVAQWREERRARGYEPANGETYKGTPRPEFVPGQPSAEIWFCPKEIADDEWRDDLLRCLKDSRWVGEEVQSSNRSVNPKLLDMAFAWHRADKASEKTKLWDSLESYVYETPVLQLGSKSA